MRHMRFPCKLALFVVPQGVFAVVAACGGWFGCFKPFELPQGAYAALRWLRCGGCCGGS